MEQNQTVVRQRKLDVRNLTKTAMCVAMLCISSYIAFPLPFTPVLITAQTIFINLIALILPPKYSLASIGVYTLLGICGLPVFSGGSGGIAKVIGPYGGYIWGFLLVVPLLSILKGTGTGFWRNLAVTVLVGMPVIYLFAALQLGFLMELGAAEAIMTAVVPFIPGDLFKCAVASVLGVVLNKLLPKLGVYH